jgi:hypothetical protein
MSKPFTVTRLVLPIALAISTPLFVISIYLSLAHYRKDISTTQSDIAAAIVSVSLGAFWLFFLPVSITKRLIVAGVFFPCAGLVLVYYAINFLGIVFNEWM